MILRLALGTGLVLLGYYIGRGMSRTEHIRRELREHRGHGRGQGAGEPAGPPSRSPS